LVTVKEVFLLEEARPKSVSEVDDNETVTGLEVGVQAPNMNAIKEHRTRIFFIDFYL
jgi:hypothetical protein